MDAGQFAIFPLHVRKCCVHENPTFLVPRPGGAVSKAAQLQDDRPKTPKMVGKGLGYLSTGKRFAGHGSIAISIGRFVRHVCCTLLIGSCDNVSEAGRQKQRRTKVW